MLLAVVSISCSENSPTIIDEKVDYTKVPPHFPPIPFPVNNPYTREKVELGRYLFYEKLLSKDENLKSCSHCMMQEHGFSDGREVSIGYGSEPQFRNTMSLSNVAYRTQLFWDGRGGSIESPAYRSISLIYILGSDTNVVNKRLSEHPKYPEMFRKAFGDSAKPSSYLASLAIATFVRTFISGNSAYDRYFLGDSSALTDEQKQGKDLFFSDRTNCSKCHAGFMFTDGKYHNTGTTTHYFDRGRYWITWNNNDRGKFITPTLRNVEVNAPYMHDGLKRKLEDVIENYNIGGKSWFTKDTLMKKMNLTPAEKKSIIAFLKSLTDWEFINNPRFKDPNK